MAIQGPRLFLYRATAILGCWTPGPPHIPCSWSADEGKEREHREGESPNHTAHCHWQELVVGLIGHAGGWVMQWRKARGTGIGEYQYSLPVLGGHPSLSVSGQSPDSWAQRVPAESISLVHSPPILWSPPLASQWSNLAGGRRKRDPCHPIKFSLWAKGRMERGAWWTWEVEWKMPALFYSLASYVGKSESWERKGERKLKFCYCFEFSKKASPLEYGWPVSYNFSPLSCLWAAVHGNYNWIWGWNLQGNPGLSDQL